MEVSEKSVEAQNFYLIAQAAVAARTLSNIRRARDLYAQASVLDPSNPKYLAGFAAAVSLQYWNFRDITPDEAISEASAAIERAIQLSPRPRSFHLLQAYCCRAQGDEAAAEKAEAVASELPREANALAPRPPLPDEKADLGRAISPF